MHSSARGRSGSKRPASSMSPDWVEYKPAEVVELMLTLSKQGHSPSEIGLMLRDQYGIPSVKRLTGKRLVQLLAEHDVKFDIPVDLMNLIRSSVSLQKHLADHKKDFTAKRGYQLAVSKIRRLSKYYIAEKKLPADWRYSAETAALLVK